jgi:hypothetical protein
MLIYQSPVKKKTVTVTIRLCLGKLCIEYVYLIEVPCTGTQGLSFIPIRINRTGLDSVMLTMKGRDTYSGIPQYTGGMLYLCLGIG